MTNAKILATAGFVAGVLGTIGGLYDSAAVIGAGSAVMLLGNIAVMARRDNRRVTVTCVRYTG